MYIVDTLQGFQLRETVLKIGAKISTFFKSFKIVWYSVINVVVAIVDFTIINYDQNMSELFYLE